MSGSADLCFVVVEVPGRESLVEALGADEAKHAIDRCMHRVDRALDAHGGSALRREAGRLCATFERADAAVLATGEMFGRVESLPPQRGLRMTIRVGIHYGARVPSAVAAGAGEAIARRLAAAARPGQAFASSAVVMQLSAAMRRFAGTAAARDKALDGLEWPVFPITRQAGVSPPGPPAARTRRLRIRHQHDVFYVDENRPVVLLGRELGNDIVIIERRASRQHARIERRGQGFVLIDQSTNGTYVGEESGAEHCVKRDEWPLANPGRIGCGFSANEVERDLVFFEIV